MVDDSHASGVLGTTGRGSVEGMMDRIDILTSTFGKALGGAGGGWTCGRKEIIEVLRQRSRTSLFSNSLPPMIAANGGKIVNIASDAGRVGSGGETVYARAKGGVIAFTKTVAKELASRNVTANAIAPGFIQTAMTDKIPDEIKKKMLEQIPLGKLGQPEDIAAAAVFLASPEADYITGQVLYVDGGATAV